MSQAPAMPDRGPFAAQGAKDRMTTLGEWGEEQARSYLEDHTFEILEQNLRTPVGECDLLARDGDHLVLVEVKTRRNRAFGPPEVAIHRNKQEQLRRIARYLIPRYDDPMIRFDVVAVETGGEEPTIRHIRGAFDDGL